MKAPVAALVTVAVPLLLVRGALSGVVDDEDVYDFYDARVPAEVASSSDSESAGEPGEVGPAGACVEASPQQLGGLAQREVAPPRAVF